LSLSVTRCAVLQSLARPQPGRRSPSAQASFKEKCRSQCYTQPWFRLVCAFRVSRSDRRASVAGWRVLRRASTPVPQSSDPAPLDAAPVSRQLRFSPDQAHARSALPTAAGPSGAPAAASPDGALPRLAAGQPAEQAEPVSAAAAASLGGAAASPAAEQPTGEDDRRWVDRDAAGDADDADGGQEQPREDAAAGAPASEAPSAAASPDLSSPPPVAASPAPVSRLDFGAGPASQAAAPASCAPRSFADTAL